MNIIGKISVFPKLPAPIERLHELAFNLWWSWDTEAQALFAAIDPVQWEVVNHNPVKLLRTVHQAKLDTVAVNPEFMRSYAAVLAAFDQYMHPQAATWFDATYAGKRNQVIAYFSAEFGLHEALPIYSGGLGVLSGDHCKAASDLDLPFVGVGFLYPQGYFTQRINASGMQEAVYEKIDFAEMPVTPALGPDGKPVLIHVDLPGRTVYAKVWRIQVGRVPIFLMDTDVERNAPQDRELSARLYGGDREMRISQEVVLGIGGVRAVRALGYDPSVWHMNEGHSAFLGLERVRELVQGQGLSFSEAVEAVRASSIFTTHTPVPAGNDSFAFELVEKFFWQYWGQLGVDRNTFIDFGAQDLPWGRQYSMTVLAIRLSAYANGVSALHGHVSREMWQFLWPQTPVEEVPITSITNGVHTRTWLVQEIKDLYTRYLGNGWREHVDDPKIWAKIDDVPPAELWSVHDGRKGKLVDFVRERLQKMYVRHGEGPHKIAAAGQVLDPHALTIGFARRFATYKRATLIFHDEERLKRILHNPDRPVQIIFSGKSHPADDPGKALIQRVYQLSQTPEYWGKIVFVENYDMNIARHMISGVDVWLNNPRRPHEASGTSGMKAAISGAPNFSVLDGWWVEGYDGTNGWAIGEEREYKDEATQDAADAMSLYGTLEEIIVPAYYANRDAAGIPVDWVALMKNSIRTCTPQFSMMRTVKEYTNRFYLPAAVTGAEYAGSHFAAAREMAQWKQQMRQRWGQVFIQAVMPANLQLTVGEAVTLGAKVWFNGLSEGDAAVEAISGALDGAGQWVAPQVTTLQHDGWDNGAAVFQGELMPATSGQFAVGIRVRPNKETLINPNELGIASWAGS
jgi:starch phosphorylase